MDDKQKINCSVSSCQYNENENEKCTLKEIHVAPIDDCETCEPDESMCASYLYDDTYDEDEDEE